MTALPINTSGISTAVTGVMVDMAVEQTLPLNGREARNLAEKNRRDKLNASIQELAGMVPHVAESPRRLDKTAVLRFAAHGLRFRHCFGKSVKNFQTTNTDSEPQLTNALLNLLDSFLITLTSHGQIVLISPSVEQLLGHCQSDLYGQSIFNITNSDDHFLLRQQLIPMNMESLFSNEDVSDIQTDEENADEEENSIIKELNVGSGNKSCKYISYSSTRKQLRLAEIDKRLRDDRRSFIVRLARAGTRSEASRTYETVKVEGCFRRSDYSTSAGNYPIVSQLIRRSRNTNNLGYGGVTVMQHDAIAQAALHGVSGNDVVFVGMGRIIRHPRIATRFLDANKLEYCTRHLIDGRIVDCDQRIGIVAGYMKDEVRNLSPFTFMHQDDVRWVIVALRQMYDCNSDYGESCYRLLTRNGKFIYLQTRGFLDIDRKTNKVHSFVCINTLLDEEEGRRRVQEMKNKFSIIINTKIPHNSLQDIPASHNPQQLERIVLYLIENLPKNDENDTLQTDINTITDESKAKMTTHSLVPPVLDSVKHSISKSVDVVNITSAKHFNNKRSNMKSQEKPVDTIPLKTKCTEIKIEQPEILPSSQMRASVININPLPYSNDLQQAVTMENPSNDTLVDSLITSTQPAKEKQLQQQITLLKRLHPSSNQRLVDDDMTVTAAKRCNIKYANDKEVDDCEIHTVISTSLQNLDESLRTLNQNARTFIEQRNTLPSPLKRSIDLEQLDAIIEERNKQQEMLVNIKSEYNVIRQTKPL